MTAPRLRSETRQGPCDADGAALVAVLLALVLLMALATGAVLTSITEIRIAGNFRDGLRARAAADAAAGIVMSGLRAEADWTQVLSGGTDGAWGVPVELNPLMADGTRLNVARETSRLRCGLGRSCTGPEMDEATTVRPWGANNPRWHLYLSSPLERWFPARNLPGARIHLVAWVGDDPAEADGLPEQDGPGSGSGLLTIRARAYISEAISRTVEVVVAAGPSAGASGVAAFYPRSWREVRR